MDLHVKKLMNGPMICVSGQHLKNIVLEKTTVMISCVQFMMNKILVKIDTMMLDN